jgi:CRISP-associated protein Cas1
MAWKGLHITKPGRLKLKDGQIVVEQEDGEARLPLEDIGWIILDEQRMTLTATLMAACAEHGIAILVSDARHMPVSITLPVSGHHLQAGVAARQLQWTSPFCKKSWQLLVKGKIRHQASTLEKHGRAHADTLRAMAPRVLSGDPGNLEAQAARQYWSALFENFIRDDPSDLRNAMLNYGYAVLRAVLARSLVASGFLPCLGLNHASQSNAFNLADDLIEPFRPFVDDLVFVSSFGREKAEPLTLEDRRALAGLPLQTVSLTCGDMTLLAASELCAFSLARASEAGDPALLMLPLKT